MQQESARAEEWKMLRIEGVFQFPIFTGTLLISYSLIFDFKIFREWSVAN